ncbi:ABC transporter ATP-binding protein [Dictyobacter aurantiacus]|uniref:ABC transporter n=1 Tax=Dictyobacter aurantiacus TaxID=1936993 RepID=A0A401ZJP3_9CHLR|nr:ATP-binding cassette domain-containing protein [Dictyobacter aurantiacus]GCE07076.1 ABC transporter [Dictyobacter aurantiacus]
MSGIAASHLSMCYRVPVREASLRGALGSLWHRRYRQIQAVNDISFSIESGELVGFIGPNGAGKTTTLKMLSGILHPAAGTVSVHGFTPWKREGAFLRSIALIRGSQPLGGPTELTVLDSLRFQQTIYEVSATDFRKNLADLTELLDLEQLLSRQVRALSLGERMRCGLALSLLYRPRVLFLDEPTLGLDVSAVNLIRRFIASYCRRTGATVLLTSHYMVDVETLCNRIILIDRGRIQYDGGLSELSARLAPAKLLRLSFSDSHKIDWDEYGELIEVGENSAVLSVRRELVPTMTARLLSELAVTDLAVEEPPLEQVIGQVYQEGGL